MWPTCRWMTFLTCVQGNLPPRSALPPCASMRSWDAPPPPAVPAAEDDHGGWIGGGFRGRRR